MIKIELVGDKPMISEHGIGFEPKHDKYEYIEASIHILDMVANFDGDKILDKITLDIEMKPDMIFSVLKQSHPRYKDDYTTQINTYIKHLDDEITHIKDGTQNSEEKNIYIENLELMRSYRIQRATNKIVYESIINLIVKQLKSKSINQINVHYNNQFLHVIESIESTIQREKTPIETSINILAEHEEPHITLKISY